MVCTHYRRHTHVQTPAHSLGDSLTSLAGLQQPLAELFQAWFSRSSALMTFASPSWPSEYRITLKMVGTPNAISVTNPSPTCNLCREQSGFSYETLSTLFVPKSLKQTMIGIPLLSAICISTPTPVEGKLASAITHSSCSTIFRSHK